MEGVRQYVISVVAAAILCGILKSILPGKDAMAGILRLITGIFLAFTVIKPLTRIELGDLPVLSFDYLTEAQIASADGEKIAADAMADIIKQQAEAYILDKAQSLNLQLTVTVTVSDGALPAPVGVRLSGTVSPYAKSALARIIEEDLGIAKENQIWTG